jgi:hypothetical protein
MSLFDLASQRKIDEIARFCADKQLEHVFASAFHNNRTSSSAGSSFQAFGVENSAATHRRYGRMDEKPKRFIDTLRTEIDDWVSLN